MIPEFVECKTFDELIIFYEILLKELTREMSDACRQKQIPLPKAMRRICDRLDRVSKSIRKDAEEDIAMWEEMKGK